MVNAFLPNDLSYEGTGDDISPTGEVGCGKTSLLLALSQELNQCSGELRLKEWREGAGLVLQVRDPFSASGEGPY